MNRLSFRGIPVRAANRKWSFRIALVGLVALIFAAGAWFAGAYDMYYHCSILARAFVIVATVVAVPSVALPVFLITFPFFLMLYADSHRYVVWEDWWFWVLTGTCEIAGGYTLLLLMDRYRAQKKQEE